MRKKLFFLLLFSTLLAVGMLSQQVLPVSAHSQVNSRPKAKPLPVDTKIYLMQPGPKDLGKPFMLMGSLKDVKGKPVADKPIILSVNGVYLGQARTDVNGIFLLKVSKDLPAGLYYLEAKFNGAHLLSPTVSSDTLQILPAEVKVQTVPAISGVTLQMDGRQFVTGTDGSATIQIAKTGQYRLTVQTELYYSASQRIEFGRWAEESCQPFRDIQVPVDGVIQAGLNVYHQVAQTFVDLDGFPVDPKRVSGLTIKSAQGDVFNFVDGQPHWLPASRVARRAFGLEETKLLYSVLQVTVDGSNVVNQAQQRFYTHPNETWSISLLLYSLKINVKDGLFGSPVGKSVNIQFPDGQIQNYPIDHAGTVEVHSLARGIYTIDLVGTNGVSSKTPVALSRNQVVNSKVITYLDLSVVGAIGLLFALGLILFGRPWLIRRLIVRKKDRSVNPTELAASHEH